MYYLKPVAVFISCCILLALTACPKTGTGDAKTIPGDGKGDLHPGTSQAADSDAGGKTAADTTAGSANMPEDVPEMEIKTTDDEGKEVVITTGKLPDKFPSDVLKPYPGAEITHAGSDEDHYALMMFTTDSTVKVSQYYEKHFTGRGWAKGDSLDMGGTLMTTYKSSSGEASCTAGDTGNGTSITITYKPNNGDAAGAGADSGGDASSASIASGKLPDGFAVDILALYPGGKIDAAAVNGNEHTVLQTSTDPTNEVHKFYDKHFRDLKWKLETSHTVNDVYIAGWNKDGDTVDMTVQKRDGGSFVSLVYTDN